MEKYLISREPQGRRRLGPDDMQAIVDLPGENYLLDLEAATVDLTLHYKVAEHWALYGIISAISYQDGQCPAFSNTTSREGTPRFWRSVKNISDWV